MPRSKLAQKAALPEYRADEEEQEHARADVQGDLGQVDGRRPAQDVEPPGEDRIDRCPQDVGNIGRPVATRVAAMEQDIAAEQHVVPRVGIVAKTRVAQVVRPMNGDAREDDQVDAEADQGRRPRPPREEPLLALHATL